MRLTQHEIDKILELWKQGFGVETIAKRLRHSKNTVKNYLRQYGLLNYSYPSDPHTGPPLLCDPSTRSTHQQTNQINKRNQANEQSNQQILQLKNDLNKASIREQNLTSELDITKKENTDLKQEKIQQKLELDTVKREKEALEKQVNEQKQNNERIKLEHQRELEEQKNKIITEKDQEKKVIDKIYHETLRNFDNQLTPYIAEHNELRKEKKRLKWENSDLTQQVKTLKDYAKKLEEKQKKAPIKYIVTFTVGTVVGVLGCYWYTRILAPQKVESGKNIQRYPIQKIPIPQSCLIQPLNTNTSGDTYSGAVYNNYEENTSTGYNAPPNRKGGIILPDLQGVDSRRPRINNTFGFLGSVAFLNKYGKYTGTGYTVIPNQQDLSQPDINNEVTLVTNIPGIQGSHTFCSSHLETVGLIPQVAIPSSFQTPINYYYIPLPSPLPDDLSEVYPMRQLRNLDGIQFEKYIKRLLDHRGCPMELTPYRDKGVDLFGQMDGKNTIIQCKQKPKVEIGVIQRLYANKKRYKADRFLVITTGEFTKDAIEEAQNLRVVCWDGKQLLQEIYKDQFFDLSV